MLSSGAYRLLMTTLFSFCLTSTLVADELESSNQNIFGQRIIVKYHPALTPSSFSAGIMMANSLTQTMGTELEMVRELGNGEQVIQLPDAYSEEEVANFCDELTDDARVDYAVPDLMMHTTFLPDDTRYNEQWHYSELKTGINLPKAWEITTGDKEVVVAVIDTGILPHKDLKDQVLPGYDFVSHPKIANDGDKRDADPSDPGDWLAASECGLFQPIKDRDSSWHGTHVAGTFAAKTNNAIGVAGVAHGSKILPVRALGKCGGFLSDIIDGMRWAAGLSVKGVTDNANPADIINMSLGGKGFCNRAYQDAIDDVTNAGVTVIVAAGNDKVDASYFTPANCAKVITVAATNRDGGRAHYSNFGESADIAAPGGVGSGKDGVLSTANTGLKGPKDDSYVFYQGTSMATPHVAGVAALMLSVNANLKPADIETLLQKTAQPFPKVKQKPCKPSECGAGILDAQAAVKAAKEYKSANGAMMQLANGKAINSLFGLQGAKSLFKIDVPEGTANLRFKLSNGVGDADLFVRFKEKVSTRYYDKRSVALGNQESILIKEPKAGTYYVLVYGQGDYLGVDLVGSYELNAVKLKSESEERMDIPDFKKEGIQSSIEIKEKGVVSQAKVTVDIRHPYRGELELKLISPTDKSYLLLAASEDVDADINETFAITLTNRQEAQGEWKLQVVDTSMLDKGYLKSWQIELN